MERKDVYSVNCFPVPYIFLSTCQWTCNMKHKIQTVVISKSVIFVLFLLEKMSLFQPLQVLTKFVARYLLQSQAHHVSGCNHCVLRTTLYCRVTSIYFSMFRLTCLILQNTSFHDMTSYIQHEVTIISTLVSTVHKLPNVMAYLLSYNKRNYRTK